MQVWCVAPHDRHQHHQTQTQTPLRHDQQETARNQGGWRRRRLMQRLSNATHGSAKKCQKAKGPTEEQQENNTQ